MFLGVFPKFVSSRGFFKSREEGEAAVRKGMGFPLLEVSSLSRSGGLPEPCARLLHLVSPGVALQSPPAP